MNVNALDHVNIVTADLAGSARFYEALLGLTPANGPPPMPADQVVWMRDAGGRAVIHLNSIDAPRFFDRDMAPGATGALHHVALSCTGFDEVMARIVAMGLAHEVNEIAAIGFRQIFVSDPNAVLLELNFAGD